jgi:hypothetical protein
MTGRSLERRVRERLGFYPSYLEALESAPGAADLVWTETERVLEASWAPERGRWLGGAAAAMVEDRLPPAVTGRLDRVTFEEPDLQRTVEFFSFVLLRLGLGISAARYAFDGEALRLEHRQREPPIEAGLESPSRWGNGAAADLPIEPGLSPVQPGSAPPHVDATFEYLTDALGTPNVNTIFRAFAGDPAFLTAVVDAQVDAGGSERLAAELRGLYAAALDAADGTPAFAAEDIDEADRPMVGEQLAAFHDNLATLLVTLHLGTRFVTGRG